MKTNIFCEKTFRFGLAIIRLYKFMLSNKDYVLSRQILRSGTSIRANVNEAQAGASKKDFIAKLVISNKEAKENLYWLQLLKESQFLPYDYDSLIQDNPELIRILTAIIKTSQENAPTPPTKN